MKSQISQEEVLVNAAGKTHTVSVQSGEKASFVLSHDIYSSDRIIEAVIREVACNAVDSHIAAGKEGTPIKVTLPTIASHNFIVEDEGVGLTVDKVFSLMGQYFSSESENSEKATGYYGLGSKSPFAYCGIFTIEAIKDGIHSIITAYEASNGSYEMIEQSSQPTERVNGVKITVPVEAKDIAEFCDAAEKVFANFMVIPELNLKEVEERIKKSQEAVNFKEIKRIESEGGASYMSDSVRVSRRDDNKSLFTIIYGGVGYMVSSERIEKKLEAGNEKGIAAYLSAAKNRVIWINIKNTPIQIAPSREEVQYTEQTSKMILKIIRNLISERVVEAKKLMEKGFPFQARNILVRLFDENLGKAEMPEMPELNGVINNLLELGELGDVRTSLVLKHGGVITTSEIKKELESNRDSFKNIIKAKSAIPVIKTSGRMTNNVISNGAKTGGKSNYLVVTPVGYVKMSEEQQQEVIARIKLTLGCQKDCLTIDDFDLGEKKSIKIDRSTPSMKRVSLRSRGSSSSMLGATSFDSLASEAEEKEVKIIYSSRRNSGGIGSLCRLEVIFADIIEGLSGQALYFANKTDLPKIKKHPLTMTTQEYLDGITLTKAQRKKITRLLMPSLVLKREDVGSLLVDLKNVADNRITLQKIQPDESYLKVEKKKTLIREGRYRSVAHKYYQKVCAVRLAKSLTGKSYQYTGISGGEIREHLPEIAEFVEPATIRAVEIAKRITQMALEANEIIPNTFRKSKGISLEDMIEGTLRGKKLGAV